MLHKTRSFTLLEAVIALILASFLLTTIFSLSTGIAKSHHASKHYEERSAFAAQRLLQSCFFRLISPQFSKNEDGYQFQFDNGIQRNPHFSGKMQGTLYLHKQCICLTVHDPSPTSPKATYTLFHDVEEMSIELLDSLSRKWVTSFQHTDIAPLAIRMHLHFLDREKATTFYYPLSASTLPVTKQKD